MYTSASSIQPHTTSPQPIKPPFISSYYGENKSPVVHIFNLNKLYMYDLLKSKKYIIDWPPTEIFPAKNFSTLLMKDFIFLWGGCTQDNIVLRTWFSFDIS